MKPIRFPLACLLAASTSALAYPFATPREIATVTPAAGWMVTEDFNHDGLVDIVLPVANNQLKLFTGNADETYTAHAAFGGWNGLPVHAVAADIGRDGHPDLVVAADAPGAAGTVVVMKNNGAGSFTKGAVRSLNFQLQGFSRLTVADFNADSHLDVLVGYDDGALSPNADIIGVLYSDESDGFDEPVLQSITYPLPCGSCAGDFNRDGRMDFVMSTPSPARLLNYRGKPDGTFQVPIQIVDPEDNVREVQTADFDRDGRPDLLVRADATATGTNHSVSWRRNTGSSFSAAVPLYSSQSWRVNGMATADFDKDGDADAAFVVTPQGGGLVFPSVIMSVNDGAGGFSNDPLSIAFDPRALGAADVDHDGDTDLVLLTGDSLMLLENVSLHRSIQFQLVASIPADPPLTGLTNADFDGDGDEDAMACHGNNWSFLTYYRNDNGTVAAQEVDLTLIRIHGLVSGDFDRDGDMDVTVHASPGAGESTITLLRNNGSGQFTEGTPYTVDGDVISMIAADWKHSGTPRVFFSAGSKVMAIDPVLMNSSQLADAPADVHSLAAADVVQGGYDEIMYQAVSTFGSQTYYFRFTPQQGNVIHPLGPQDGGFQNSPDCLGVAGVDLDRDGDIDPVVARLPDLLTLGRNEGAGNFTTPWSYSGRKVKHLRTADFDADGYGDVLSVEPELKAVKWRSLEKSGAFTFAGNNKPEHTVVADVDRDGRPDFIVNDTAANKLMTVRNIGGEYTASVSIVPDSDMLAPGDEGVLFTSQSHSNALPGEADIYMAGFELKFGAVQPGGGVVALTEAQAIQLIDQVILRTRQYPYEPSGSGPVLATYAVNATSLTGNSLTATLAETDFVVSPGQFRWLDFSLKLKPGALQAGISKLAVTFVLEEELTPEFKIVGVPSAVIRNDWIGPPNGKVKEITLFSAKPIQIWRKQHFNTYEDAGDAANSADPDKDRVPNIVEYVQGTVPVNAASARPLEMKTSANGAPEMQFLLASPAPVDARVEVQASLTMKPATWFQFSGRNGNGQWIGNHPVVPSGPAANGIQLWAAPDTSGLFHFYRLRAIELP